jgi:hypothetical protein
MTRRPPRTPEEAAERQKLTDQHAADVRNACDQLINTIWRKQYEVGKGRGRKDNCVKLLCCRDLCAELGRSLPDWSREAFDREHEAWQRAGKTETFEEFLVEGDPRGRRSKDDELRHRILKVARKLAIDWKIAGERTWEFVAAALAEYQKKHQCWDETLGETWQPTAESVERIYRDLSAPWPKYPKRRSNIPLTAGDKKAEEAPSYPGEEYLKYEAAMAFRGRKKVPYAIDDIEIYYELMALMAPRVEEFSAR